MASIHTGIRDWLLKQPDWLQEATERLLKQDALTDEDIEALVDLIKTPGGRTVTKHRNFRNLVDNQYAGSDLRLIGIRDISGIENLSPREPMNFGAGNLTVIYGHNGSGKSSYTRILKKASGQPRAVELKSNVFRAAPAESKCQIIFKLDEQVTPALWHANAAPIDAIRAVDFFDNDEAIHYLSKESAASYTPPVVALFESLATVCDQIRELLQTEQEQLISSLPTLQVIHQETQSARSYNALRHDIAETTLQQLLTWTEAEQLKLNDLTARLKVEDPSALAKKKRGTKTQTEQIIAALKSGMAAFGGAGIQAIRTLQTTATKKRQIATEAAHVESAILGGIGSSTWSAMWEAARSYSQTVYTESDFPVLDNAHCLLCHQQLDTDAGQRLRSFETFVQGKLETEAKTAETSYQEALNTLPIVPTEQQINTECEAAGLGQDWKEYLLGFWNAALSCREKLISREVDALASPVDNISESIANLQTYSDTLESEAAQCESDAQNFDRSQAKKDKLELEAKLWVSQQSDAVREEIKRLKSFKVYEDLKALTNPRGVSLKASEVAEQVITRAYVARFNHELSLLGATNIKVELIKTRTERGRVLHQLNLKGSQAGQLLPDAILSDGERRIISLAAFLADVADKPQPAPFIFDDPVSSLDHDFEWNVANRLAELAKDRQVLVFTHRLSLYGAMDEVSKKIGSAWKKQHYHPLCIESYSGVSGHPVDQATWNANTKTANNILLDRLGHARREGEAHGGEAYRRLAQGVCSDFRKLLERTVEDDLLNEIVKRHRRSITTDNRLVALPIIENDDCQLIDELMTKYSYYEHSQSQETPAFIPEEQELKTDIEQLKNWRQQFKDRIKANMQ